jgi:hypothetical protein
MAVNFLEQLVAEWYEYQGYFIRRNVRVGKLPKGGYECELDIVAFHPETKHLLHIEPSTDADSWDKREKRYKKKFDAGRKYIPEMFPALLPPEVVPEQIALLVFAPRDADRPLGGGHVMHVSAFLESVITQFSKISMLKGQVPEQFTILRTLQFVAEYRNTLFKQAYQGVVSNA